MHWGVSPMPTVPKSEQGIRGGIESVLAVYKESMSQIELGDSPYLAPVLEKFY